MRTSNDIGSVIREHSDVLLAQYGVEIVGMFGSRARGEAGEDSDIDLLVNLARPVSLFELVGAEQYLEDILGAKVDLVPTRDVREELRDTILREAVPV